MKNKLKNFLQQLFWDFQWFETNKN